MPPGKSDVAALDAPVTHAALLDALKLVLSEMGTQRADSITAEQIGSVLAQQARVADPSNPHYPSISAYSYPEGDRAHPKPDLARETWVNNVRQDVSLLTPAEILAFNALSASLQPGAERSTRGGKWQVKVSKSGHRLLIILPCSSIEDKAEVNASSIGMFCKELLEGQDAVTPDTLLAQMARLEAEVAKLKAGQSAVS